MLLQQGENVPDVVLAFARPAFRLFCRRQLEYDQVSYRGDAQLDAALEIDNARVSDCVGDSLILRGKLNRRPSLQWLRTWRAPVIAVQVTTRVFEPGA